MVLSKKEVEILISRLQGFEKPKIKLEQYETLSDLAAYIVYKAVDDIYNKRVIDLGCGTGILSFVSYLFGSSFVLGVDIDLSAIKTARENKLFLEKTLNLKLDVNFIVCDVNNYCSKKRFDVCVMNPPFGVQKKFADRIFLKKAFEISDVIWTIFNYSSEPFVKKFSQENGFSVSHIESIEIPTRAKYPFHKSRIKRIPADLYRIERLN